MKGNPDAVICDDGRDFTNGEYLVDITDNGVITLHIRRKKTEVDDYEEELSFILTLEQYRKIDDFELQYVSSDIDTFLDFLGVLDANPEKPELEGFLEA